MEDISRILITKMACLSKNFVAKMEDTSRILITKMAYLSKVFAT